MTISIRELEAGDEGSVRTALDAFCRGRGGGANGYSEERWRWAYARNPHGRRVWVAEEEGRIVAHFAAQPHAVWLAGREASFAEVVDAFVDPRRAGGLKKEGLYVRTGRALLEACGGPEGELVFYGRGTLPEWRLGKELLGYEVLRTQTVLARAPGEGEARLPAGVESLESFDEQARWLWDRCCPAWGASTVRDAEFLTWRFVEHPVHAYTMLGVRDAEGILRGYAVCRPGDVLEPNTLLLVDWLVPPDEPEVGELLLQGVLALARREGAGSVATFLVEWSPWFDAFQRWGFLVLNADTFLFMRSFAKKFDDVWLRGKWWTTWADWAGM